MVSKSDERADLVLKTKGTFTGMGGGTSTHRHDRIKGRYYFQSVILNLKELDFSRNEIARICDMSPSSVKVIGCSKDIYKMKPNQLDNVFGFEESERLRVKAVYECMSFLSSRGWEAGESQAKCVYDVFALKDADCIKIQVRSSSKFSVRGFPQFKTDKLKFNTNECRRIQFEEDAFDYWFFHSVNGDSWIIPKNLIETRSLVSMEGYEEFYIGG